MSYSEYKAGQGIGTIIGLIIRWGVKVFFNTVVYMPILMISFTLTKLLEPVHSNKIVFIILTFCAIFYFIYCFVFFIKGIVIALRVNNNNYWKVLVGFAILLTCGLPAIASYLYIHQLFIKMYDNDSTQIKIWSGILSLCFGYFVYTKYQFHKDVCPQLPFWAYKFGFKTSLKYIRNPIDSTPDKSEDLF